jgi:tRNA(adenine34) deaminase
MEERDDPTAHAEMLALAEAAREAGRRGVEGATLFVTVEPCPMCMGAAILARLSRVVFGTPEPRTGACGSLISLPTEPGLPHRPAVRGGVMEEACRERLRRFFRERRERSEDPEGEGGG